MPESMNFGPPNYGPNVTIGKITKPCNTWCTLLGVAFPIFPQCALDKDHEGDHKLVIKIFATPSTEFTITWKSITEEG